MISGFSSLSKDPLFLKMPSKFSKLYTEGVLNMKKVALIFALALGVSLMTSGIVRAGSYSTSYEHIAGALTYGGLQTPFSGLGSFIINGVNNTFGDQVFRSMFGDSMAQSMGDSMNSGMSMYGGKMSALQNLKDEFASLQLRTANETLLEQMASGSASTWTAVSATETLQLGSDAALAQMTGF